MRGREMRGKEMRKGDEREGKEMREGEERETSPLEILQTVSLKTQKGWGLVSYASI